VVLQGHKADEYKGVAAFFNYCPAGSAGRMASSTGYLPLPWRPMSLPEAGLLSKEPRDGNRPEADDPEQTTDNSRACASATTPRRARSWTTSSGRFRRPEDCQAGLTTP